MLDMPSSYNNPVGYVDGVVRTDPDPYVLRFRGRYYCYSTDEQQVNVSVSDDLVHWMRLDAALVVPGRSHYWAPCVVYSDGLFYMYVSFRPTGSDDPHEELLHLATSARPEGPFTVRHRFFDTFAIDAHVVPDGDGGWVMFYSTNDVTGLDDHFTGTSIVADRLVEFDRPEGRPRAIVTPSLDEEIFERNRFGDGRDWYTIEGATYFTRGDRAYLTYSGNAYEREEYFIGYATAALNGGAPHELAWTKHPDPQTYAPLVRRSDHVEGTGHNSIVRAPNLVDDWIVYHGRDAAQPLVSGTEQRRMRIDAVVEADGALETAAPTVDRCPAPAAPTVGDLFDDALDRSLWRAISGDFVSGAGELRTGSAARNLVVTRHVSCDYVAEAWIRLDVSDLGARAGVVPVWLGESDYLEVAIDTASAELRATEWHGGVARVVDRVPLPNLDPTVWHHLAFWRRGHRISVTLDDRARVDAVVRSGPASIGLSSTRTEAAFSGFAVTDHASLRGEQLGDVGRLLRSKTPVVADQGGLSVPRGRLLVLEGVRPAAASTAYEVSLSYADSEARMAPWVAGERTRLDVIATPEHVQLQLLVEGRVVRSETTRKENASTATLRTTLYGDSAVVHIDGRRHLFDLPRAERAYQRIELRGARLSRYEFTALGTPLHHFPLAKEQA